MTTLLFTFYLHMAAAPELADAMTSAKTTGLAYETVRDQDGTTATLDTYEWGMTDRAHSD